MFYLNLGDGRFADLSGVAGLDFPEDGRAFGTLDFDGDGDLDLVLRNRNAPQLRLLRNDTPTRNHSVAFRLVGRRSNRDAVGAAVTLVLPEGRRTQHVRMGSGFLSQSSRMVVFGVGEETGPVRVEVSWPSGTRQAFFSVPVDHRVTLVEDQEDFAAEPFRPRTADRQACAPPSTPTPDVLPDGYPLVEPVPLPQFALPGLAGEEVSLASLRGQPAVLNFWATWCVPCQKEMALWKEHYDEIQAAGAQLAAISVDEPGQRAAVKAFVQQRALPFPVLLADRTTLERFNIFHRHLLARYLDLEIPTTFLLDAEGRVVKFYRGVVSMERLLSDLETLQRDARVFARAALPYAGRWVTSRVSRNYFPLAAAYASQGFPEDAGTYYRRLLEAVPDDARAWHNLGVVLGKQGAYSDAAAAFRESVRLDPADASGHVGLAAAMTHLGRQEEAADYLARAAELDPDNPRILRRRAALLAEQGELRKAIAETRRYLSGQPDDAAAHNALGMLYVRTGQLPEALASFQQAVSRQPEYADAWSNLAAASMEAGDREQARLALERLVALDPERTEAHFNLGVLYAARQDYARAAAALARAVALDPDDPEKRLRYAAVLAQEGELSSAIASLERYLELRPDDARARYDLGVLFLRAGSVAQAIESFRRATELEPGFAEAFRTLGVAYLEKGMSHRAAESLQRAVELNPQDADAHLALAYALWQAGRPAAAERSLERVLELRPNDARARELLRQVRQAPGQ